MADYISKLHPENNPDDVLNPDIVSDNIPDEAVTTAKIGDSAVTTAKLDDASVTADKLSDDVKTEINNKVDRGSTDPDLTSGYAENLTPYSAESGATQDEAFLIQGTGCANGTAQVDTGSYCQLKKKVGNGLNVNQLADYTNISAYAYTTSGNTITVAHRPSDFNAGAYKVAATVTGHKYFINIISDTNKIGLYNYHLGTSQIATAGTPMIYTESYGYDIMLGYASDLANGTYGLQIVLVDLTQMYGGNDMIPTDLLTHPDNFYRYYAGSLDLRTGGMLFADGQDLKTYGRNQWDEEWILGSGSSSTGIIGPGSAVCSKNYIRINPNTDYYIKSPDYVYFYFYDVNKTFISIGSFYRQNESFTTPANAIYCRFQINPTYGNVYNHDITISLYYTGESGYSDYYPYTELDSIDTGDEPLYKARNVADIKYNDGTIERNIISIDLSELTWTLVEDVGYWYFVCLYPTGASSPGSANVPNAESDNYIAVKMNDAGLVDNTIAVDGTGVVVRTNSTSTQPSGMLYVERETPVTEQGTPFKMNVNISDFGSMLFDSPSGIPQGIEIFYPADYKAFIDSAYNRTDGDASNIALTSELTASELARDSVDTQLKNALGGTLRQLLALTNNIDFDNTAFVDLGGLNWTMGTSGRFYCDLSANTFPNETTGVPLLICTKYKTTERSTLGSLADKTITLSNASAYATQRINARDTAYTSADTFKTAMKGVLLAYEKA